MAKGLIGKVLSTHFQGVFSAGRIEAILKHDRKEGRPSSITAEEHKLIEKKLHDPKNGLRGYVELLNWVEAEFNKTIIGLGIMSADL